MNNNIPNLYLYVNIDNELKNNGTQNFIQFIIEYFILITIKKIIIVIY